VRVARMAEKRQVTFANRKAEAVTLCTLCNFFPFRQEIGPFVEPQLRMMRAVELN
jgi:hypothetical protein